MSHVRDGTARCLAALVLLIGGCGPDTRHLFGRSVIIEVRAPLTARPVAGVMIQVNDLAWIETDAQGQVRFEQVDTPYTVRSVATDSDNLGSIVYARRVTDVADRRPTIIHATSTPRVGTCSISGQVDGRRSPTSTVEVGAAYFQRTTADDQGRFTIPIDFYITPDTDHVQAIEREDGRVISVAEIAIAYPSTEPCSVSGLQLELRPVESLRATTRVEVPTALANKTFTLTSYISNDSTSVTLDSVESSTSPMSFDLLTITNPIGKRSVWAYIHDQAINSRQSGLSVQTGRTLVNDDDVVSLSLPAPTELLTPNEDAEASPDTAFQWKEIDGASNYSWRMNCEWPAGGFASGRNRVQFAIGQPNASSVKVPTFPGVSIPPGTLCVWSVTWSQTDADGVARTAKSAERRVYLR